MVVKISKFITLNEAIKSQTATRKGIDNTPDFLTLKAMQIVGERIHTPVREHFKKPIPVSSFYRSPELNREVGGAKNSQHVTGQAIDMDVDGIKGITNAQIFHWIKDNLAFDQLIWEYGTIDQPAWVHCSYKSTGNRNQVLFIGVK